LRQTLHRAGTGLLAPRRVGALECLVAFVVLGIAGALIYGPHVRHGGLFSDDWGFASLLYEGSFQERYERVRAVVGFRPVGALSIILRFSLLGIDARWHQAAVLASTVVMCTSVFLVLRMLRFQRLHAGAIALLILACPYADATRLWAIGSGANIALTAWLLGVAVALRGMSASTPGRRIALHAVAVALYVISLMQYEVGGVVVCLSALLYFTRGNWRRVLPRSAADIAAVVATLGLMAAEASVVPRAPSLWHHAKLMFDGGVRLLVNTAVPFGWPSLALVLVLLGGIALAGGLVAWRSPQGDPARRELVRWLIVAGGGLVLAGAGWAMYVPAYEYYHPLAPGLSNRTNTMAAPGLIVTVYGLLMVAGLLVRRLSSGRVPALAVSLAAALVVLYGLADRERASARVWDSSYSYQRWITGTVQRQLPDLPPGSTVYTFGHPIVSENPGVPIFSTDWELNGAIRTLYRDQTISAFPAVTGSRVVCGPDTVAVLGGFPGAEAFADRYGEVYFVNVPDGRTVHVTDRRQCESIAPGFTPGPRVGPVTG
jgi:hypothetical protein